MLNQRNNIEADESLLQGMPRLGAGEVRDEWVGGMGGSGPQLSGTGGSSSCRAQEGAAAVGHRREHGEDAMC
jgi:hypothetical protein